jgi:hypothetical protein
MSKCRNFLAEDTWPRRTLPWLVPASISQTPPKASRARKISGRQRPFDAVATLRASPARRAASPAFAIGPEPGCCTTSAIWSVVVPATWSSFTRSTCARSAASSSNADTSVRAAKGPLYPPRRVSGSAPRSGGRLALSCRRLAPVARPPGPHPLRHHLELGGARGEKGGWANGRRLPRLGPG